jgi:hypothetical protein
MHVESASLPMYFCTDRQKSQFAAVKKRAHTPIHKQRLAGRRWHVRFNVPYTMYLRAVGPDTLVEELKVCEVAMDVSQHVAGRSELKIARLLWCSMLISQFSAVGKRRMFQCLVMIRQCSTRPRKNVTNKTRSVNGRMYTVHTSLTVIFLTWWHTASSASMSMRSSECDNSFVKLGAPFAGERLADAWSRGCVSDTRSCASICACACITSCVNRCVLVSRICILISHIFKNGNVSVSGALLTRPVFATFTRTRMGI